MLGSILHEQSHCQFRKNAINMKTSETEFWNILRSKVENDIIPQHFVAQTIIDL